MNDEGLTLSTQIGIKLWFAPQISEHWPYINPGRLMYKLTWFKRPGVASALTPKDGIVHEWSTSMAVINIRIWELNGMTERLSTSSKRILFNEVSSLFGIIYESNSILLKSEYS